MCARVGPRRGAHLLRCRPSRMGVMLFYLLPAFFCDVSDGWRLPDKAHELAALHQTRRLHRVDEPPGPAASARSRHDRRSPLRRQGSLRWPLQPGTTPAAVVGHLWPGLPGFPVLYRHQRHEALGRHRAAPRPCRRLARAVRHRLLPDTTSAAATSGCSARHARRAPAHGACASLRCSPSPP